MHLISEALAGAGRVPWDEGNNPACNVLVSKPGNGSNFVNQFEANFLIVRQNTHKC